MDKLFDETTYTLMIHLTEMGCDTCRYSEMNNPSVTTFDKRVIKCKKCLEGENMWSISRKKAEEIIKEIIEDFRCYLD